MYKYKEAERREISRKREFVRADKICTLVHIHTTLKISADHQLKLKCEQISKSS